jgi:hypothetical protein
LTNPEDNSGGDANGGEVDVCAPIIEGVDTSPVLLTAEHILDLVALAMERAIVGHLYLAIGL